MARCNGAFATLLDRAPADLVGRPWTELWLGRAGEEPSPTRVERARRRETFDLHREQGWFRLLVDPVLEGESVTGLVCIVTDVTIERQAADVRAALFAREQEAREEAEATNRAKDEFLAMLGHELRNPLDVIADRGRRARLAEPRATARGGARARSSRGRCTSSSRLVDDLLDVGRVTTGKIRLRKGRWTWPRRCAAVVDAAPEGEPTGTRSRCGPSRLGRGRPVARRADRDEPPVQRGEVHARRRRASRSR